MLEYEDLEHSDQFRHVPSLRTHREDCIAALVNEYIRRGRPMQGKSMADVYAEVASLLAAGSIEAPSAPASSSTDGVRWSIERKLGQMCAAGRRRGAAQKDAEKHNTGTFEICSESIESEFLRYPHVLRSFSSYYLTSLQSAMSMKAHASKPETEFSELSNY